MTTTSQTHTSPLRLRAQIAAVAFALASLLATGGAQRAQAQTFSVLYSFTGYPGDGDGPGDLVMDTAGSLYGTTFVVAIPAGSFRAHANGNFTYHGAIDGVRLEIRIASAGPGAYEFHVNASGVNLTRTTNPAPVTLTIPNRTGTAEVTAEFRR